MIGFRVLKRQRKVDAKWIEPFAKLPVANISDVMSRMTASGAALRPRHDGTPLCGPALTVKTRPGDNLMVHKALDVAEPGDVIVVDAGGDLTNALIGELMVAHAVRRGLGGMVIYGAIRDSAEIAAGSFPVFSCGITHRGPYRDGPGEINVAIAIEGMVIEPGDLVCGGPDGLVVVPFGDVETVYAAAAKKHAAETAQLAATARGENDRSWVDETLRAKGCEIE